MGQPGHGKKTDQGGCAQYQCVPARFAYKLTSDIDANTAVLLEPLGVSHQACEELQVKDEDVLICGSGPIGLMGLLCAKAMGARRVIMADVF